MGAAIVSAITQGLGIISELGSALNDGFNAIFLPASGTGLSNVGVFAFVLLGLGISVGIVKKCFNWITGRHGM